MFNTQKHLHKSKKNISIFGSSKTRESSEEFTLAYNMGKLLALNGYTVVNGGYGGIMLASAKGASENGGHTIGVTLVKENTGGFIQRHSNAYIKEEILCANLFERLYTLIKISSAYILFPGGTGTLLELAAVWELINKKLLSKRPIILLGDNWQGVIEITAREYEENFSLEKSKKNQGDIDNQKKQILERKNLFSDFIFQADTPEDVLDIIINFK